MSCLILAQEPIRLSLDLATPTPPTLPAAITLARSNNPKEASSTTEETSFLCCHPILWATLFLIEKTSSFLSSLPSKNIDTINHERLIEYINEEGSYNWYNNQGFS